ncbi:MAG: M48 family metalloprotease [Flavobacteriales bacterium]|nr:M48 family metalloprotease [Flavobacteriales bacterium]
MKKIILIIPFLQCLFAFSQISDNFDGLKCEGEMPLDFKWGFAEKSKMGLASMAVEDDVLSSRDQKEFIILTNYINHKLLLSGDIVYGDPISELCNKIVDHLLKGDESTREHIRVYTLKTDVANAFSTNEGIIYVTTGLVARLDNEAQLAFVLAHEIGHYVKHHVLQNFSHKKELYSRTGRYGQLSWEEKLLNSYQYSREAEFEADDYAYGLHQNAGYSEAETQNTLNKLLYAELPILEKKYDWHKIETDSFKVAKPFLIDSCQSIAPEEDVDDTEHTHPNVKKRKAALADFDGKGTKLYDLIDSVEFAYIRDLARFEMVKQFLIEGNFSDLIYHIHALETDYPNHPYLQKAEAMAWFGMQQLINNQNKYIYNQSFKNYQGYQQEVKYFFFKMGKKGINAIATRYIWMQSYAHPNDSFYIKLRDGSMEELANSKMTKSFFYTSYDEAKKAGTRQSRNKYMFARTLFVDMFDSIAFKQAFDKVLEGISDDISDEDEIEIEDTDSERHSVDADRNVAGIYSHYGLSGVDRVIYFRPIFSRIDYRKTLDQLYVKSNEHEEFMANASDKMAEKTGVELVKLNDQSDENFNTETFNDFITLSNWLSEQSLYEFSGTFGFTTPSLDTIRLKHQTDYLAINVTSLYTDGNKFNIGLFLLSAAAVTPFPFYLYWQLSSLNELQYNFYVFDLKSGKVEFYDSKFFRSKFRKDVINAHLYNSFNQLNRAK